RFAYSRRQLLANVEFGMSREFFRAGHGPQRRHWPAVSCEPVSAPISLLTGKLIIRGNFAQSQCLRFDQPNSLRNRTGNFLTGRRNRSLLSGAFFLFFFLGPVQTR